MDHFSLDICKKSKKDFDGKRTKQKTIERKGFSKKPVRNPRIAAEALQRANYKCEICGEDNLFIRKNSHHYYTEPHHLIPISKYKIYEDKCGLDVGENIISLCSYCHNLLHYGRFEDKKQYLDLLYKKRQHPLKHIGLEINIKQLYDFYK